MRWYLFIIFVFTYSFTWSASIQEMKKELPSLKGVERVKLLYKLGIKYRRNNIDSAEYYTRKAFEAADLLGDDEMVLKCYSSLGVLYKNQGRYDKALYFYDQAILMANDLNREDFRAKLYNNKGVVYKKLGKLTTARDFYQKALNIKLSINDSAGIAASYGNIGVIYKNQGKYNMALDFYLKANRIQEALGDKRRVANSYINIAGIYKGQKQIDEAIKIYQKVLDIALDLKNKKLLAVAYNNIGTIYRDDEKFEIAISSYRKALKLSEEIADEVGVITYSINIGEAYTQLNTRKAPIYLERGLKGSRSIKNKKLEISALLGLASNAAASKKFGLAQRYYNETLRLTQEIGFLVDRKEAFEELSEMNESVGDYKSALYNYKQFKFIQDSLRSADIAEKLTLGMDSLESEKLRVENERIIEKRELLEKEKKQQQWLFIVVILSVLIILLVFARSYRQQQSSYKIIEKQKGEVEMQRNIAERQKEVLEIKNDEILSSIQYAQRIQQAILPSELKLNSLAFETFVAFRPKDIVSGDFYWAERVDGKNRLYFTAADCTGHGVPGAMVSVVCSNALTKAIRELGIRNPARILDEVSHIIETSFDEGDGDIADGMDLGLACIDKEKGKLYFSGANNPLYILRKIDNESNFTIKNEHYGLIEMKADIQPIGKYFAREPFTTTELELKDGDTIYSFSDGYADQFGGPKGKKYKYKPFKRFLLSIQGKSMSEQRSALLNEFDTWKGNEEQIDDVCIFGVRYEKV